jgi:hypothetical protein
MVKAAGNVAIPGTQFIILGQWDHIFDERTGAQECRVVFDTVQNKVSHLDVMVGNRWHAARAEDARDVDNSLKEANAEVLDDPVGNGFIITDELPAWATVH